MNKRLEKIVDLLIKKTNCVYDVGCDHCQLAYLLLLNNKAKIVINIENKAQPLKNGVKYLKKVKMLYKTINLINDGLQSISNKIKIQPDYVTICGMSANSIIKILINQDKNIHPKYYVLQANRNLYQLRKWLINNTYKICKELTIKDKKIFYQILLIKKTSISSRIINNDDLLLGKFTDQLNKEVWYEMLQTKLLFIDKNKLSKIKKFKKIKLILLNNIKLYKQWKLRH